MGIKTVQTYFDDWDDTALPEDTKPVQVTLNGVTYDLYLTEENQYVLTTLLDKIKAGTPTASTSRNVPKTRSDKKEIRVWAHGEGKKILTAQGIKIPGDRGPIHADVYKAYDAR